jgi:hypothetical protein
MKTRSLPELSRMADKVKPVPEKPQHSTEFAYRFSYDLARETARCAADGPAPRSYRPFIIANTLPVLEVFAAACTPTF